MFGCSFKNASSTDDGKLPSGNSRASERWTFAYAISDVAAIARAVVCVGAKGWRVNIVPGETDDDEMLQW